MAVPAPVANVAAAGADMAVIVSWTVSADPSVTGYQVRLRQGAATVHDWRDVAGGAAAALVRLAGLTNGLAYTAHVRATNPDGPGPAGDPATATPVDVVLRQVFDDADLSGLEAPPVVEALDYEAILAAMAADLRARDPRFDAWVESEPTLKLLEVAAYREYLLRRRVNDSARAVMLAFAAGGDLDHLAALLGVVRTAGESDATLRARVRAAPTRYSTAGSEASYRFWASSVAGISDAQPNSPAPGDVDVWVLAAAPADGSPSPALVGAVAAVLGADRVRPLTDTVTVRAGRIVPYRIAATLDVASGPDAATVRTAAEAAARNYALGRHRLGVGVPRSALIAALHVAGVDGVNLTAPAADVPAATGRAPWPTAGTAAEYVHPATHPLDGIDVRVAA